MATKKSASSTTGKRTTKKSSSAKKSAASEGSGGSSRRASSAPRAEAPKRMSGPQVAQSAQRQLLELTGKDPEGVTGLQRGDEGWTVQVEVVEVRRIPNTTDVLATYEVEMSTDGELSSYRRLRRYARGVPGED
jgi:hypothetical protein